MKKDTKKVQNKGSGKKKILIAIIVVIIIIVVAFLVRFFSYRASQVSTIKNEAKALGNTTINEELQVDITIKTKNEYAVIEQTMKDYINQIVELEKQGEDVFKVEELEALMSQENLASDAKEFTKSKETISNFKTNVEQYMNEAISLLDKEKFLSMIDDKDISNYYKKLYKDLINESGLGKNLDKSKETIQNEKKSLSEILDYYNELFNYLSENQSYWFFSNGLISFNSQEKLDGYMEIVGKMKNLEE